MKYFLLLASLILFPAICAAQQGPQAQTLTLAAPIADHMVLQQGMPTSVWGNAAPESTVTVTFGGQKVEAKADAEGRWEATLAAFAVSAEPAVMEIACSDGSRTEVKDILVGEVWMCSGQSNMQWTLARIKDPAAAEANLPMVRLFTTKSKTAAAVQRDCEGDWKVCTPESAAEFSAVGFHFGKELHESLNVPIGLVDTSWGGRRVEAFTSREKLETVEDAIPLLQDWDDLADRYDAAAAKSRYEKALEKWESKRKELIANAVEGAKPRIPRRPSLQVPPPLDSHHPSAIYNQKVAPWTRYAVAGTIWYQGESNRDRAVQYESLLTALIEDWRQKWNREMPFYVVQLANYQAPTTEPGVAAGWAELQYFQTKVTESLPNSGIAVINDIGDAKNIHPTNKRDVGHRLALLAQKKHYGKEVSVFASPLYKSHRVEDDHLLVTMKHVGEGLKSRDGGELKRFEIAGADQKWHWAKAAIVSQDSIRVSSDAVPQPVAVRYAWASNPQGANLVNSGDLPASIFRTDDWPLSTEGKLGITNNGQSQQAKRMKELGFTALFNGKDLDGWRNPYGFGNAKVVGREIHLTANKKFFLVTEKAYSDFVLFAEIKLPEGSANSGVMFRCHVDPEKAKKVYGYQAECDGSDRRWSAGLYDEARRGWIWPRKKEPAEGEKFASVKESQAFFAQPEIRNALKRNGWNRYKITCQGNKLQVELNGVKVTDLEDDTDAEGFIGIQHHGEQGQTYRFRNLYLKTIE